MRRLLFPLLFAALPLFAMQSPSQFLGIDVGADRTLADYKQIVSYFRALGAASPRVQIEDLGRTTLGNDFIMAVISSEANMKNLPRIREIAKKLADPRGLSDAEVESLAREGKAIVLVTCNIHSTEIASSQMAMEWAYALATANDDETKRRLDNVVLLLVPSLNPDGQLMVTDWYRKYLGTKYEGGRLPGLYHHYVGHDNNRDWFMLTQVETQEMSRAVYHEWYPQVFVDEHQMGIDGPRMFIPPFADPVDPDVHPLIWREVNIIGSNMAFRLEQANKSGMIYGYSFDAYWLGGTRNTGWWKNITGLLLETASAKIATPARVEPTELRGGVKGLIDYKATINHPHPWEGGIWRMRDIMDYERIASDALLETAADRRVDLLRDLATRARAAVASAKPGEAYRVPADQHDRGTADKMLALLLEHGVEIRKSANGDYWIPMAQPYAKFITEMLEPQRYPEVRLQPGKEILRPYDVATWTLPLAMGVMVEHVMTQTGVSVPVTKIEPAPDSITLKLNKLAKKPRVAILNPWGGALDEGWTRWLLEQYGLKPASLRPNEVKAPLAFDAFIIPDVDKETIATGTRKADEGSMKYNDELPPEYRGGIGNSEALKSFVNGGGTLIALGRGTEYVIDQFNIPVRNALARAKADEFSVPGSLVRIDIAGDHPVTAGMPAQTAAFIDEPIAFETTVPGSEMQRWVLASYPEEPQDVLLSGWINGADKLTRKAAAVAMTYGKGRIVLFGFHPQHRGQTHATFPLLFNAIEWQP